jgi:UTP--glucose-1-phosphate uridylyltransferase
METAHRFGIAVCSSLGDGRLRVDELVEKPPPGRARSNLSVLGRYVVTGEILSALERLAGGRRNGAEVQLTDGFAAVLGSPLGVLAVPYTGEVFDSGTPEEYAASGLRYLRAFAAGV